MSSKDKTRDFKGVPGLQRALQDVSPNPAGVAILGMSGRSWQGELPPRVLPQGVFCGHGCQRSSSSTVCQRGDTAWVSRPPPRNRPITPASCSPSPLSLLTVGGQALHMKDEPEEPDLPRLYLERPGFQTGQKSEENWGPQSGG